jgi:hypothetical protein
MSNTLRIKRRASGSPGAPASLANAELAYNEVDETLYYGKGTGGTGGTATVVEAIAGSGAVVMLAGAQTVGGIKTFTSSPIAPTPTPGDSSTTVATTAFVAAAVTGGSVADGNKGDITVSGSGSAWTVNLSSITNAKLATVGANTLKGNNTGSTAVVTDLSITNVKTMLSLDQVDNTTDANKPVSTAQAAAIATKVSSALLGVANGVATLDGTGKLNPIQLPAIAVNQTYVVASQSAMTALGADIGDTAVRTDVSNTYILAALPPTTLANWQILLSPTSPVSSVFGRTGAVTAASGDYTVSQVVGAAPLASPVLTGSPSAPTQITSDSSTLLATTAFVKAQGYTTSVGTVTSVAVSGGTTGLITSGGPITGSGTISLSGTLNVNSGGTGVTTLTGLVKGTGTTAFVAATSGTDFSAGTSALTTGILKSTTTTGALSIAVASDFPSLNQNTTGSAAKLTTARTTGIVSTPATFDGSGNVTIGVTGIPTTLITGTLTIANGGTGGTTQASAQSALGLGSMATQNATAVAITGGTIDSVVIDGGTF